HDLCSGCGLCWNLCPFGAIEIGEKITGEIFVNQLGTPAAGKTSPDESGEVGECGEDFPSAWLVSGRSVGVVEETGPVVAEVKKFAYQLAEEKGVDVILLDTAPGLHCAVIRALWEVDKAYAVTEPTPLGAHDLRLILKLLKKLRIPAKIILNQADLGDRDSVDNIAHNLNTEIAYEIPYSKEIVNAYSKGRLYDFSLQHF
ncbi:MAG: 4Fe-4S binding protein, partial [Patescibacteria group bacterium]